MTATRIVLSENGRSRLETFDYRSEFAFDDFAELIASTLGVQPTNGVIREEMSPFDFVFEGSILHAAWSDEHGCYVEGEHRELEAVQQALSR